MTWNEVGVALMAIWAIGGVMFFAACCGMYVTKANREDVLIFLTSAPMWPLILLAAAFIRWVDAGREAAGKDPLP